MTEDLDTFLADFGESVTGPSSVTAIGIFDQPDEIFGSDVQVISTEYRLLVKTSDFGEVAFEDVFSIRGDDYSVRSAQKTEDGAFTRILLSKVNP